MVCVTRHLTNCRTADRQLQTDLVHVQHLASCWCSQPCERITHERAASAMHSGLYASAVLGPCCSQLIAHVLPESISSGRTPGSIILWGLCAPSSCTSDRACGRCMLLSFMLLLDTLQTSAQFSYVGSWPLERARAAGSTTHDGLWAPQHLHRQAASASAVGQTPWAHRRPACHHVHARQSVRQASVLLEVQPLLSDAADPHSGVV